MTVDSHQENDSPRDEKLLALVQNLESGELSDEQQRQLGE